RDSRSRAASRVETHPSVPHDRRDHHYWTRPHFLEHRSRLRRDETDGHSFGRWHGDQSHHVVHRTVPLQRGRGVEVDTGTAPRCERSHGMTDDSSSKKVCAVCRQTKPHHDMTPAELVRPALHDLIRHDCADWNSLSWICHADLHRFTAKLIENMLTEERGELGRLDVEVLASLRENEITVKNINEQLAGQGSFGGR